ncbi:MAG: hypothetical protein HFH93_03735 [Lachnospiraceae bacterium]|nr:hypothetical protein [Lachnospiraceae bacterium]
MASDRDFRSGGIIVNIDINSEVIPFFGSVLGDREITEETFYPFVDQYVDLTDRKTQVRALAFDIFCQYSTVDSQVFSDYYAIWRRRVENGVPVNYDAQFKAQSLLSRAYGIDPYAVWFRRTRERGLEAWMSVRMNDCHCPDEDTCFLRSDFFYEAKSKGWMIGDLYGYRRNCFDYAVPQVRQKMLDYIEEQLARYDVDALELDFLREITCFDYLNCPDRVEIMNDFVRNVRALTDAASAKRGHRVRLVVRLMRDIQQNLVFGFDVQTWVSERLVDHVSVSPRWATCDSDMPIAEWRARFPDMQISAGVETLVLKASKSSHADADVVNGLAAAYISQGADYIYLYNYFINPRTPDTPFYRRTMDIIPRCGMADTVFSSPRRHIVTYQDIFPSGHQPYRPLPLKLECAARSLEVHTGYVPAGREGKLIIGLSQGCPCCVDVAFNGRQCGEFQPARIYSGIQEEPAVANAYVDENVRLYQCPVALEGRDVQEILFRSEKACVDYIEIAIE